MLMLMLMWCGVVAVWRVNLSVPLTLFSLSLMPQAFPLSVSPYPLLAYLSPSFNSQTHTLSCHSVTHSLTHTLTRHSLTHSLTHTHSHKQIYAHKPTQQHNNTTTQQQRRTKRPPLSKPTKRSRPKPKKSHSSSLNYRRNHPNWCERKEQSQISTTRYIPSPRS